MPYTFYDLPPDHPIFTVGPSFVFKNDLPPEDEQPPAAGDEDDEQDA